MLNKIFKKEGWSIAAAVAMSLSSAYAADANTQPLDEAPDFPNVNLVEKAPDHNSGAVQKWVLGGCLDTKTNAKACEDRAAIVVYGGEDGYAKAAYNAAVRLDNENIPVAFIRANDNDTVRSTASIGIYANGELGAGFISESKIGLVDATLAAVSDVEQKTYDAALDTYNTKIKPMTLTSLSLNRN